MCAKSLKGAQHIGEMIADAPQYTESYKEGVLVGGMVGNIKNLSQQDIRLIEAVSSLFTSESSIPEVARSFRSLWKPFQTPGGMLFREKEHVVIQTEDSEFFCQVETFLCLEVEENTIKLVKLQKYEKLLDSEGAILTDPFSGGVLVDISVSEHLISPVGAISRKVMLYNYDQGGNPNTRTVIDFQREQMPITFASITVPFFPERNDMILIRGDDPDPWVAKVLTIQERAKTVRVLYYMKDEDRPGQELYIPYRNTRLAHDIISWDSILGLATGEWKEDAFELMW